MIYIIKISCQYDITTSNYPISYYTFEKRIQMSFQQYITCYVIYVNEMDNIYPTPYIPNHSSSNVTKQCKTASIAFEYIEYFMDVMEINVSKVLLMGGFPLIEL